MYLKKFTYKPSLQTWHLPFVQYVVGRNIFEGRGFDSRRVQSISFFFFLVDDGVDSLSLSCQSVRTAG